MHANIGRRVAASIRDVPDFPVAGVVFKDITPMLGDATVFRDAVEAMAGPFLDASLTHVLAIESRGFLFASPLALAMKAGVVLARKPGRLPWKTSRVSYDLEYRSDALEIHVDSLSPGDRVLIVDDVLATGGTAAAAVRLVEQLGATPVGVCVLVELSFLGGRERLPGASRAPRRLVLTSASESHGTADNFDDVVFAAEGPWSAEGAPVAQLDRAAVS